MVVSLRLVDIVGLSPANAYPDVHHPRRTLPVMQRRDRVLMQASAATRVTVITAVRFIRRFGIGNRLEYELEFALDGIIRGAS